MAIPNRQSLIFTLPEALLLKMENQTGNLEKSMLAADDLTRADDGVGRRGELLQKANKTHQHDSRLIQGWTQDSGTIS